jgi:four helix bundle protein
MFQSSLRILALSTCRRAPFLRAAGRRRASAEGTDAELARFCCIARGSGSELEYHLLLARDLKLIEPNDYEQLAEQTTEIKRMLTVFVRKLSAEYR